MCTSLSTDFAANAEALASLRGREVVKVGKETILISAKLALDMMEMKRWKWCLLLEGLQKKSHEGP